MAEPAGCNFVEESFLECDFDAMKVLAQSPATLMTKIVKLKAADEEGQGFPGFPYDREIWPSLKTVLRAPVGGSGGGESYTCNDGYCFNDDDFTPAQFPGESTIIVHLSDLVSSDSRGSNTAETTKFVPTTPASVNETVSPNYLYQTVSLPASGIENQGWTENTELYLFIAGGTIIIFAIIIVLVCVFVKKRRRRRGELPYRVEGVFSITTDSEDDDELFNDHTTPKKICTPQGGVRSKFTATSTPNSQPVTPNATPLSSSSINPMDTPPNSGPNETGTTINPSSTTTIDPNEGQTASGMSTESITLSMVGSDYTNLDPPSDEVFSKRLEQTSL